MTGGFTIDGKTATSFGITLLKAPDMDMLPKSIDRTVSIPGKGGDYWFSSDLAPREFSLPCMFQAASITNLDTLIRAFARIFVHSRGRPRPLEIEFDDHPGYKYLVRYNGKIPFERKWVGCSYFTLELIADDPYAYAPEEATEATITTEDTPGDIITSSGNVETPAEFCFENTGAGSVSGFSIKVNYEEY